MKIINALEAPEAPNPHGVSARGLHSNQHVQAVMVTLQPGQALKLHVTPRVQGVYQSVSYPGDGRLLRRQKAPRRLFCLRGLHRVLPTG